MLRQWPVTVIGPAIVEQEHVHHNQLFGLADQPEHLIKDSVFHLYTVAGVPISQIGKQPGIKEGALRAFVTQILGQRFKHMVYTDTDGQEDKEQQ